MSEIKYADFTNGRPKRKYVKDRLVECPLCKHRKISFWDPTVCNHNQDEEGEPTPLVYCIEVPQNQ